MQKKKGTNGRKIRNNQTKTTAGKKEKRRIAQLMFCVILFLVVFVGKELKVSEEYQSGRMILQMIQTNTDFKSMFRNVGDVISGNISVLGQFEKMAVEVFGPADQIEDVDEAEEVSEPGAEGSTEQLNVSQDPEPEVTYTPTDTQEQEEDVGQETETEQEQEPAEDTASTAAGPEVETYTGPALPEGTTMDYYELGLAETVTPVLGRLTSPYGYRVDPIGGGEDFHVGVDLSAEIGTPVLSFASGTVDFIGESEGYGLYVQIDHGNGIKTFYCHCSQLCVQKGMQVSAGQVIAKTGNTGNTTGPHLHMEMKLNDVLLNPEYYIEVLPL